MTSRQENIQMEIEEETQMEEQPVDHKNEETRLQVIFVLAYVILFVALVAISLHYHSDILMPIIQTMAEGFAHALNYLLWHLPRFILERLGNHLDEEDDT